MEATQMTQIFTSLKRTEMSFHPATGKSTTQVFDIYTLVEVNGNKHIGRHSFNGYVNYGFCQWGVTDSKRIAMQFGFSL
jgi:hypothetical protein